MPNDWAQARLLNETPCPEADTWEDVAAGLQRLAGTALIQAKKARSREYHRRRMAAKRAPRNSGPARDETAA